MLKFKFNEKFRVCRIPSRNVLSLIEPRVVHGSSETEALKKTFLEPIGSPSLKEFLVSHESVGVVINDATRPTPSYKVLDVLYRCLRGKKLKVIVATGSHRKPFEAEYRFFLGGLYDELRSKTICHDARDQGNMEFLGRTNRGTDVFINREVLRCDALITVNSVEPHYFAGFTGGRKSLVPGVAGYETIEMNHKFALERGAETLRLKGNPVHEDLENCLEVIGKEVDVYSFNMVLDRERKIYDVSSGDIKETFYEMVRTAKRIYCAEIKEKADVVITVASSPFDINLYQSQKALENAKLAVKEGGIVILVSGCHEGIGPDAFYKLLSGCSSFEEALRSIKENYRLGYHKAAKLAELGLKSEIWAVTGLPRELLSKIHIKPFRRLQEAVDKALEIKGGDSTFLIIRDGAVTVPLYKGKGFDGDEPYE